MMNKKNKKMHLAAMMTATLVMGACTQTTPSMMNTSRAEIARETIVEQIPVNQITDQVISRIVDQYTRNGDGPLELTMTYDPKSKSYTAMKALHELSHLKSTLKLKGVANVTTQTLPIPQGKASLMVSYDMLRAQGPSDCTLMPGLETNETGRFIDEYKFGCSTETLFARQVANPSDLEGKSEMPTRDARRESIIAEDYGSAQPRPQLDELGRGDLQSE